MAPYFGSWMQGADRGDLFDLNGLLPLRRESMAGVFALG